MFLKRLVIENFKNYKSAKLDFTNRFICFSGDNGAGKTNLLDAIHYLSLGKSYFNPVDSQNINHDENYFSIKGVFEADGEELTIFCAFMKGKKKTVKRNDVAYDRLMDHVGSIPSVVITPYDINLLHEGSEERRKFLDNILSQVDRDYLENLSIYQKTLMQRNSALKNMYEKEKLNRELLEVYDESLVKCGEIIFTKRKAFLEEFIPHFKAFYKKIADDREKVEIKYHSPLEADSFADILKENIEKDYFLQRTSTGIHKDDLEFLIGDFPVKKFGSQGQQKSFIISLKLAKYHLIREKKGFPPLLLLDDLYDRLDEGRVNRLIKILEEEGFDQVFITDTSFIRVDEVMKRMNAGVDHFKIKEGIAEHV